MNCSLKNIIRKGLWYVLDADPRNEYAADLMQPRRQIVSYAVSLMNHQTSASRQGGTAGQRGSLLGDYLEFGCYRGESFIYAYRCAAKMMPWMKFFAFDSFEGLPHPRGPDSQGPFWKGQYCCSRRNFMDNINRAGLDMKRVKCVSGWYDKSLTAEVKKEAGLSLASLVYIDCDLYESHVYVLSFITDIIETGTILMFDDWFSFNASPGRGAQKAVKEWLLRNPRISLQDWHLVGSFGKSFIVTVGEKGKE